jgi:hypothetical protein
MVLSPAGSLDVKSPPKQILTLGVLLALSLPGPILGQDPLPPGTLRGQVFSLQDSVPLAGVTLTATPSGVEQVRRGGVIQGVRNVTDDAGRFSLDLGPGSFDLAAEAFGYVTLFEGGIRIREGEIRDLTLHLETDPFRLEEIVVMPSTFGLLREHLASGQILSREELRIRPQLGNDIFRTVSQVPGVTSFDHSAVPYVRGSRAEEVLTILDGLELHEPYHLKQWDGSLSIVDVENIQDVDFTTGGFTTEYGDASAGVLSMRTAAPHMDGMRTTVGLDFMSSMLKSEGSFQGGRGSWLLSARRGFLDLIFELTGLNEEEDLHPSYFDLYSRMEYEVRPGHRVSAHLLHAGDDNHGIENDSTAYRHRYGSSYAWVNWAAELNRTTNVRTMFSLGRVWRDRNGADFYAPGSRPRLEVRDQATYDFLGLRQDWRFNVSRNLLLKAGVEARWGEADYEYFRWEEAWQPNPDDPSKPDWLPGFNNLRIATRPSGNELGVYTAARVQPAERLTVEGGLRYDSQSHTDARQMSPRFNAAFRLGPRTNIRGAWGHYHQSHALHQLWVGDGDETFYPAQRAEHRVLGAEHELESGITLRLEAYQRLLTDPLPEYRNLEDHTEALKEEGPEDRVFIQAERGKAQGIELYAKSPTGSAISWSIGYALSKAGEVVEGKWVPRPFDQRHALNLQVAVRPDPRWCLSLGWIYHSPWPSTAQSFHLHRTVNGSRYVTGEFGPLNQERLIPYHRIDFRVSGDIPVTKGSLMVYLDVFNATNRPNVHSAGYGVWIGENGLETEREFNHQLEMMPSLGIRWVF